jgi:hypothetical protein
MSGLDPSATDPSGMLALAKHLDALRERVDDLSAEELAGLTLHLKDLTQHMHRTLAEARSARHTPRP